MSAETTITLRFRAGDLARMDETKLAYITATMPSRVAEAFTQAVQHSWYVLTEPDHYPRLWTYHEGYQDGRKDWHWHDEPLAEHVLRQRGDNYRKGYAFGYGEGSVIKVGHGGTWAAKIKS